MIPYVIFVLFINPKMSNQLKVRSEVYGTLQNGKEVNRFILKNENIEIRIINYGAIITDILAPDRKGECVDISLGFDNLQGGTAGSAQTIFETSIKLEPRALKGGNMAIIAILNIIGYENNIPYFGAVCGRVVNRIADGKFTLDGKEYQLAVNGPPNHIHGGLKGFDKVIWEAAVKDSKLELKYVSADGEEGYPGEVTVTVTYELTSNNELAIDYTATTTKPTQVNLTNHAYFNLAGHDNLKLADHLVTLHADSYTPLDENTIPTGEILSVEGSPYDIRKPTRLDERIKEVNNGNGFDINYCLGETGVMKCGARVEHPPSGRVLEIHTTEPGLQFYTSKNLQPIKDKGGIEYQRFAAFCLEPQHYADSVNHANFPSTILRPGETYRHTTVFKFSTC